MVAVRTSNWDAARKISFRNCDVIWAISVNRIVCVAYAVILAAKNQGGPVLDS
jgi:hypothetical protein